MLKVATSVVAKGLSQAGSCELDFLWRALDLLLKTTR